jgi:hypothetical protein
VQQVVLQFGFEKKFVCKKICLRTLATAAARRSALSPPLLRTRSKMLHCTLNERSVNFVLNERSINSAAPRAW